MSVEAALNKLESMVRAVIEPIAPFRATVTALSGGLVSIRREDATSADTQLYARAAGWTLAVNDVVLCLKVAGQPFVLCKIQNSAAGVLGVDGGFIGEVVSATPVYQDAADTASTVSTATYQQAASMSFTLPAGTWTVEANGALQAIRNTAGQINVRMSIDGTAGSAQSPSMDLTIYTPAWAGQTLTAVSGGRTITILLTYKNNAAATATARQPMITARATRTA